MLMVIPLLAAAVPLLLLEPLAWWQAAGRLGLIGLGFSAWIDLVDNCAIGCAEHDPPLLSGAWALSGALLAAAVLMRLSRARSPGG
jgi:hypothetical protein